MKRDHLIVGLDKKELKLLMLYIFEQTPKANRTITQKDIIKLNPAKLPEILMEMYKNLTGRDLVAVSKTVYLQYNIDNNKAFSHIMTLQNRNTAKVQLPQGAQPKQMYEKFTLVWAEQDKLYKEELSHKFRSKNLDKEDSKMQNKLDKTDKIK